MQAKLTGGCLCGGVRYTLLGERRDVFNCFCGQCQKTSGHYVAATCVATDDFVLDKDTTLKWYRSSDIAERGFCCECGSSLFWNPTQQQTISVMVGTIDKPTGLKTVKNIYVEDMSDYHRLPRLAQES